MAGLEEHLGTLRSFDLLRPGRSKQLDSAVIAARFHRDTDQLETALSNGARILGAVVSVMIESLTDAGKRRRSSAAA
jgi:hypothetical protein